MPRNDNNGRSLRVKVFTATKLADRPLLGEVVTAWLEQTPGLTVEQVFVRQSSSRAYHCLSIVVFHRAARSS